ncbi:MAG TPA: shikimate dehydrogenase [Candidatus Limnocylindrales bacterium]|nr:shikimate dehydrogenase [Candidatus Limnocylindrales bacterium]
MTQPSTSLFAILGHPVHHSLSPRMQNAAFRAAGRDAAYIALDILPGQLAQALEGLHEIGFAGLNVTLPHKEEAFTLVDSATPAARAAGAANTLRRAPRGWEGDATDGAGFLAWLDALGLRAPGARALLIGAGGAARSVAVALAQREPAEIRIVNRTPERAESLKALVLAAAPLARVATGAWAGATDREGDAAAGGGWDFIVRALASEEVVPEERRWWGGLKPGGSLLDLNYGARAGAARTEARSAGFRYEDGLGLLLEQGALSFEFWTGTKAPREAMRGALDSAEG